MPITHTCLVPLTAWRTYTTAVRLGSLSAAAAELGYTQSAVSRQIATLEREVGVRLLERHGRGVAPTPAGRAFARHALVVVDAADRAVNEAREPDVRTLIVGAPPSLAAGVVPSSIRRLLDAEPGLRWTLVSGSSAELYDDVLRGAVDVAVVTDAPPGLPAGDAVLRESLGTDEMMLVVAETHRLARRRRVDLAELAQEAWVEDNAGSAALLRQAAARAGFTPHIALDAADLPGKLALVAAGHGVALAPASLRGGLRSDVRAMRVAKPPTRGIFAIHRQRAPGQVATLIRFLAEALA